MLNNFEECSLKQVLCLIFTNQVASHLQKVPSSRVKHLRQVFCFAILLVEEKSASPKASVGPPGC